MKILTNGVWADGYLDYHCHSGDCRVRTIAWRTLGRIDGLYFVRPKSIRLVYNYLREVGGREVSRKVVSRMRERSRNDKYISCGFGQIIEGNPGCNLAADQYVVFLAPNHPECVERIVLPRPLLSVAPADLVSEVGPGELLHVSKSPMPDTLLDWQPVAGWSPYSGSALSGETIAAALEEAVRLIGITDWTTARRLRVDASRPVRERTNVSGLRRDGRRKSAVLVGFGNYAKTIVVPNTRRYLDVECIHEIDPTQVPRETKASGLFDTADEPREGARYDAWLIAGYHHTHAPLAIKALRAGSYAVVEKPLATDECQLAELLETIQLYPRFFAGFHKRYSPMNNWARTDLQLSYGDAVSYHCIVFEVPLPARHWYRWPNSRSRIVSNGCHWIDHFLFLNGYSSVQATEVQRAQDGTTNCFVTLRNGASFTMVLTDQGSARVGVRDHVELRANGRTVRMTDGASYHAESTERVLRRAKVHKYRSFERMYRSIGRAIRDGADGDSPQSVAASTQLVLALDAAVRTKILS